MESGKTDTVAGEIIGKDTTGINDGDMIGRATEKKPAIWQQNTLQRKSKVVKVENAGKPSMIVNRFLGFNVKPNKAR